MQKILAGLLGITIMMPGLSLVKLGSYEVQPALPIFGIIFLVCILRNISIAASASFLGWMALYCISLFLSTLFSVIGSGSEVFLIYQFVSTTLFCWGLYAVFVSRSLTNAFINCFVAFACISSILAGIQALHSQIFSGYLLLTNNDNFTLAAPVGRGIAFAPEASVLASFLFPAFAAVWDGMISGRGMLNPWLRGKIALSILAVGLVSTRSSTLLSLPLLILLSEFARSGSIIATIRYFTRSVFLMAPFAFIFASLFLERLSNSDADLSALVRLAKIQAGFNLFMGMPFLGRGLGTGSNSMVLTAYEPAWVAWSVPFSFNMAGIDSWLVRTLAEQGIVGGITVLLPIAIILWRMHLSSQDEHTRTLWLLAVFLLPSFILAVGYRDMPFMFAIASAGLAIHRLIYPSSASQARLANHPIRKGEKIPVRYYRPDFKPPF